MYPFLSFDEKITSITVRMRVVDPKGVDPKGVGVLGWGVKVKRRCEGFF